ncbi:kinase D-interacting substrate of 220 kDa isoform X1 [Engraulis encrasicolus]|uniref:kinase D-interacting substrate of 220 kDa isoform X1 n=1 Tax=Engraulis encrasicolus TaxID=184585 RepID=UPI002FD55371
MTALIVAVKGGYTAVVEELLKRNPNVNMTEKDGNTALMIAAIEGHTQIVQDLLDTGTYVNIPDRSGDTVLIAAVRGGHVDIVRALLNKYADIDVRGQDSKTALYWAVEKGNATMVRDILQCNPDTEACTKDAETPLIKATKMRNIEIVELLLDKGARVSAVDRKGDTALHIAIQGRSRKLAELLLRNPKDGRLLYRPNKEGETPYNIDCTHQKSILTQIFGAKHLSPSETDGDMLGYDLYSSALADILSEPTMQPPICVGLYAQWGSGKSFLLKKLEDEMKTFAGQQVCPLFQFSWLVVILTLLLCGSVAFILGFTVDPKLAIAVSLSLLALTYIFFVVVYFGSRREGENWNWAWVVSTGLARHIGYMELLLKLMFVNPPELPEQTTRALPVRFLFTDYNRLSSVGGETSMAEMIATLSDACEREFGFMATRLFRVFKNNEKQAKKWKKTCCVPSFVLFALTLGCLVTGLALLAIFRADWENVTVTSVLVAMASVVGLAVLLNCRTWWQVADSVLHSQRKRLHRAADNMHKLKSEGFMKVLKCEVELMDTLAKAIDGFTQNQTRLVVIIDGLDSCEQDKVLMMLDTVRVLFSKGPFISIFASDPHIIIKAINQNLNSVLRDSNINGHDYMRNIVHLPVFLQSRALNTAKKVITAAPTNGDMGNEVWHDEVDKKQSGLGQDPARMGSMRALNRRDTYRRRQMQRSQRQLSFDLTKLLVTEDWFSDISPQTMRRLLNIVSVTGRLLRANQIVFNWDRLASWINLTEEWPYRTSWLILFLEETDGVSDLVTLKTIYERISKSIPTTKDVEPLLEIDGDIRSFEVFLSSRTPVLCVRDVEMFLPCTVNLDPKLREIIADVRDARDQMPLGGMGYPALQEGPSRSGASVFGHHHSAALSPGGPGGPFPPAGGPLHHPHPPQPHSSYYSGLTGPQHPFYNRPYFPHHVLHRYPHNFSGQQHHAHPPPPPPPPSSSSSSSRPPSKGGFAKDHTGLALAGSAAAASAVPSAPWAPLSSLGTDAMCDRLKQVEGLDPSMLEQYTTTIKKANVNGRVLSQCNLDELKNEMNMNFGDWQLFRAMVMEQRSAEMQPMHMPMHDESHAGSELGSIGGAVEDGSCSRRGAPGVGGPPSAALSADPAMRYSLNLSFEELSAVGLEEPQKQTNAHWTAPPNHRSSMTSLNSQESSNDICKLTDKQQAEYRNAYQEYIAQMAQIEGLGTGAERPPVPVPPYPLLPPAAAGAESDTAKEGEQQQAAEGRGGSKPFPKGRSKVTDTCDGDAQLDPITEEDEKADAAGAAAAANARALLSRKSKGLRYHQVPGSDEEEEESDSSTPLLSREERRRQQQEAETHRPPESIPLLLARAKAEYLSEAVLDKKESSDSGHRSSGSSSDHSLQDADSEPEKADPKGMPDDPLAALEMLQPGPEAEEEEEEVPLLLRKHALPRNLSGLQQDVMRMSICSEAASEASSIAMASSPEENWPTPAPTPTKVIFNRSASSSPEENWSTPTQTPTPTGTPTPTPNANLNRSASSGAINNNSSSTNNSQHAHALHETITPTSTTTNMGSSSNLAIDSPPIIISPGSSNPTTSITTTALLHNQNLRAALHRKRSAAAADGHADEERESVL